MEEQIDNMKIEYQRKVDECFENLQQGVEDSYKNIDEELDEFLYNKSNQCHLGSIPSKLSQNVTKLLSNCQLNLQIDDFQNQIVEEVNSFINNNILEQNKKLKQEEYEIQQNKIQYTIAQQSTFLSDNQPNLKPFTYQLLNNNTIKQDEWCHTIAINKDCSIVVAACSKQIKVRNDNNTFTFQPFSKEYMHIYEMNGSNKQYIKTKDIRIKGGSDTSLFPQQYIKQKCILINKNASNVNLIRKKLNGEFIIEDTIQFKTDNLFGCISDDGQFLITWDDSSQEYQIRQYKEI